MRGTLVLLIFAAISTGIIPAYAGNTESMRPLSLYLGDHPRVCGEHLGGDAFNLANGGSSPRMRGTPGRFHNLRDETGIIPAYAGNTYATVNVQVAVWDHPRVCGEHCR